MPKLRPLSPIIFAPRVCLSSYEWPCYLLPELFQVAKEEFDKLLCCTTLVVPGHIHCKQLEENDVPVGDYRFMNVNRRIGFLMTNPWSVSMYALHYEGQMHSNRFKDAKKCCICSFGDVCWHHWDLVKWSHQIYFQECCYAMQCVREVLNVWGWITVWQCIKVILIVTMRTIVHIYVRWTTVSSPCGVVARH